MFDIHVWYQLYSKHRIEKLFFYNILKKHKNQYDQYFVNMNKKEIRSSQIKKKHSASEFIQYSHQNAYN